MLYELLVRVTDKIGEGDVQNARLTKRGDVIAAQPSPHPWGRLEVSNPDWIIIKADITQQHAASLLAEQSPPDLTRKYFALKRRGIGLDIASLDTKTTLSQRAVETAMRIKDRVLEADEIATPASILFE